MTHFVKSDYYFSLEFFKILILFSKRLNEKRVVIFCPKIPCDDLSGGTRVLWPNVKDLTRDKL